MSLGQTKDEPQVSNMARATINVISARKHSEDDALAAG